MATNLFSRAAAYRKKHPGMSMPEAVKAVSKGSKPAKKKAAVRKKAAPKKKATIGRKPRKAPKNKAAAKKALPRKVKVKIKGGKKGGANVTIGKPRTTPGKTWAKEKMHTEAKKHGLRLVHGYEAEGRQRAGIHGMSMSGISHEHSRQARLHNQIKSHGAKCKIKGISKQEKANLQREAKALREQIAASKKLVTVLKRSI